MTLVHTLKHLQLTPGPLAEARDLIQRAAEIEHIYAGDLPELIDHLSQGVDWGSEELAFDFLDDELRVSFHDLEEYCDPADVIRLLRDAAKDLPKD